MTTSENNVSKKSSDDSSSADQPVNKKEVSYTVRVSFFCFAIFWLMILNLIYFLLFVQYIGQLEIDVSLTFFDPEVRSYIAK